MFVSVANTNTWWAQRSSPIFIQLFRRRFCASLKETVQLDEEQREFLPWLESKAGMKISSMLSIGKSTHGRTLIASKKFYAGDCILQVPYSVQLAPDNLSPEILSALGDDVGSVVKVALLILHERKLGQASEWAPYISCLPSPDQMHSTIFWSDDELEMIRPSALYQETLKQKMHIEKQFEAIKSALNRFPDVFKDLTLEDFRYAFNLVTSRAWESSRGVSLIPFADFLNHDGSSESYVLSDESHRISEVIADRDYAPNDQVLIRYGRFSNATLLLDFGFTLHCNTYDQVQVQVDTMGDDPLSAMKLELFHRHHIPTKMDINGFATSTKNTFTIKEVKSPNGKGRGIPQSMRAFSRVLSSHTIQELSELVEEAAQSDGRLARRPLKNKSREIEAHELLYSTMDSSLAAYNKYIEVIQRN
ncbi:hypothetical protein Leryth_009773 [Lithospermum erythrorhizon]|nr:hypothetical protein Leryth_009773 [Lithospermum erythrorhizon]